MDTYTHNYYKSELFAQRKKSDKFVFYYSVFKYPSFITKTCKLLEKIKVKIFMEKI